jgi:hypothetical protein
MSGHISRASLVNANDGRQRRNVTYVGINLIVHSDRLRLLNLEIPDA